MEAAAREAAGALRALYQPLAECCVVFDRIGLLNFRSSDEAAIVEAIRAITQELKAQNARAQVLGVGPFETLNKIKEAERSLRAIAIG